MRLLWKAVNKMLPSVVLLFQIGCILGAEMHSSHIFAPTTCNDWFSCILADCFNDSTLRRVMMIIIGPELRCSDNSQ